MNKRFIFLRASKLALYVSVIYMLIAALQPQPAKREIPLTAIQPAALVPFVPDEVVRHSTELQHKVIEPLIEEFSRAFVNKMRKVALCQISGQCPVRLLVFEASDPQKSYSGLADRLRGMASLIYAAFASNRVFIINWKVPVPFEDFFMANEKLYGIDLPKGVELYKVFGRNLTRQNFYFEFHKDQSNAYWLKTDVEALTVTENTPYSMDQSFKNPAFWREMVELRQIFYKHAQNFPEADLKLSYELAMFIGLRFILSKPTAELVAEIERLKPKQVCQIGVHIRAAPAGAYDQYLDMPRLTPFQVENCFLPKIFIDAKKCYLQTELPPLVYLASDSAQVKRTLNIELEKYGIMSMDSGFKSVHIDRHDLNSQPYAERKRAVMETFVDWFVLASSNRLILTRSGFGELASTYGSFMSYRLSTSQRLAYEYNEECDFEPDYVIRSAKNDPHKKYNYTLRKYTE